MVAGSWKPVSLKDKEVQFKENNPLGNIFNIIKHLLSTCWVREADLGTGSVMKEA